MKPHDGLCIGTGRPYRIVYQGVIWSADDLPYCSVCGMCLYDAEFQNTHGQKETYEPCRTTGAETRDGE